MTAIAAITTGQYGYMISDSLCYDDAGKVTGFGAKIQTLPHSASIVAVRGQVRAWQWATELLGRVICFDQIESIGPEGLRLHWPEIEAELEKTDRIDIIAMGWSHRSRSVRAVLCSSPHFAFTESPVILAPMLSAERLQQVGIVDALSDPGRGLVRVIKAQRDECLDPDENGRTAPIGGRIVLTVLTVDTIGQRVIAELPMTL